MNEDKLKSVVIDRFEGEQAILVDKEGTVTSILKIQLPKEAKEGDYLDVIDRVYQVNKDKRKIAENEVDDLLAELLIKKR